MDASCDPYLSSQFHTKRILYMIKSAFKKLRTFRANTGGRINYFFSVFGSRSSLYFIIGNDILRRNRKRGQLAITYAAVEVFLYFLFGGDSTA